MLGLLLLIGLQMRIDAGAHPSVGWHVLVIGVFVAAELLIHITAMEYAYRAAPGRLRSIAMSFRPLTMSLGNVFVAVTTGFANGEGAQGAPGVSYYVFFLVTVAVSCVAFILYAARLPASDADRA